ncbi:acyltransferase [Halovivax limisalsi]|uniref:acyltransferase n=1 Tax=Halovivax limisalsi TaxID=1453760 RepID=UPI001FFCFE26|nr:acyltransferase [Halovivax limisalsi]
MGERIHSIDTLRALTMGFIVALHAEAFEGVGDWGNAVYFGLDAVGRFAVPFFFLTAGYLFAKKHEAMPGYAEQYLSRIASIYGFAVCLYVPLFVATMTVTAVRGGGAPGTAALTAVTTALSPIDLLYYGDSMVYHLWFLPALVVSVALVYAFVRAGLSRYLLPIAFAIHLVGLTGESYTMIANLPIETRDGLFFGFFYTSLGYAIRSNGWEPGPDRRRLFAGLTVLGALAHAVERYALGYVVTDATIAGSVYTPEYTLVTVFYSVALFGFVLSYPSLGRASGVSTLGRYAVWIYIVHPIVLFALGGVAGYAGVASAPVAVRVAWHLAVTPVAYAGSLAGVLLVTAARPVERVQTAGSILRRRTRTGP